MFVINSLAGGGAERVMATLLRNSEEWLDQHEIRLAVLDHDGRDFALPSWLDVVQLNCGHGTLRSIVEVDRAVAEWRPDVTVSFLTRANLATVFAMTRRGRPCIISERTSTSAHLGSGPRQLVTKSLIRFIYPRASQVIAVSDGVAAKLARNYAVGTSRLEVIPNPVDISRIEADAREKARVEVQGPYILAVGRLVAVKNYALLIRAFARADISTKLVIAGDGPERVKLESLAADLDIADRVILPGWVRNPYPLIAGASLFALSSNVEGFPNALVEALALGIPVVATNCSDGPAEILASKPIDQVSGVALERFGILTPVGDEQALTQALELGLDDEVGRRLRASGRERAHDYAAPAIAACYWAVIEQVLEQARAGSSS
jgi:glycosyltransferase involved in cell wall biosynthesis